MTDTQKCTIGWACAENVLAGSVILQCCWQQRQCVCLAQMNMFFVDHNFACDVGSEAAVSSRFPTTLRNMP